MAGHRVRRIGVVTAGRSDYGIYIPILHRIEETAGLELCILATGMHLSPEFGLTVNAIEDDGFRVDFKVESLLSSDTPEGVAKSMGLGVIGFSQVFGTSRPDMLLVLGDRFEMHAAALAALPFRIPLAHIHGGESTEGQIDEALRHSITKLSHLHFTSTEEYARRVVQMGEEPWRVHVCGAPALDLVHSMPLLSLDELEAELDLSLSEPPLLVTYHPVTLEYEDTDGQVQSLLSALGQVSRPVIFTYPNADTSGRTIIRRVKEYVSEHHNSRLVFNLGQRKYFSLMKHAAAMVGNSSSGIIEAATFRLPGVNIGKRQQGRIHPENVIDTGYSTEEIRQAIAKALSPDFRNSLVHLVNPYGQGEAAVKIVGTLRDVAIDDRLLMKRFYSLA